MQGTPIVRFYAGNTRMQVAAFSTATNSFGDISFSNGANGSASGTVEIAVTDSNRSFLNSLKRNSHFIGIFDDDNLVSAGVIETRLPADGDGLDVMQISFYGFWEFLDEISIVSSFKAAAFGQFTSISPSSIQSWVKGIYANSPMMLAGEIFKELRRAMAQDSLSPFWRIEYGTIPAGSGEEWSKSYELASLEYSKMQGIIEELITDDSCQPVSIYPEVSGTGGSQAIRWVIEFSPTRRSITGSFATSRISDLSYEDAVVPNARRSFAKTDFANGGSALSNIIFDNTAAYSTYVVNEVTGASTGNVQKLNSSTVNREKNITGQLSFKTDDPVFAIVGAVYTLDRGDGTVVTGLCSDMSYEGSTNLYTTTLTVLSASYEVNAFRRSVADPNFARFVKRPLEQAQRNARSATLGSRGNKTGFRRN